jgi:hypothetical protein
MLSDDMPTPPSIKSGVPAWHLGIIVQAGSDFTNDWPS